MAADRTRKLTEVDVRPVDIGRFESITGSERMAQFRAVAERLRGALDGSSVVNVNSTAIGGGVAELLQTLVAYARGAGIATRWLVIGADPAFFAITKRIHNGLYGTPGDGGQLGAGERELYEAVLRRNGEALANALGPRDIVLLHDPQTAGLAPRLRAAGVPVVWRCHVGLDEANQWTERSWEFLRPYVADVDGYVFSRENFAPAWVDRGRLAVIPPSIDPFSPKNQPREPEEVAATLAAVGVLDLNGHPSDVRFTRRDGSTGRIASKLDLVSDGPLRLGEPVVLQASRWDAMKDMPGVMKAFARSVDPDRGAHLVLSGPAVRGVTDDPEAVAVFEECIRVREALPTEVRRRVHLACTPMHDADEAAAIVNAQQRFATVVVQKSLAEGFGLTVVEAMWKARPVIAGRVGGIVDQIIDGEHGILVEPTDLDAFGAAVDGLLADPAEAGRLAANAYERARTHFLCDRHLIQYGELLTQLCR
jgi:trehalose synthase